MLTAALIVLAFTLSATTLCGSDNITPLTLNPKLETECNGPRTENHVTVIPDVSYPFRTDYLTLHEGKAYDGIPISPTESNECNVDRHGKAELAQISPFIYTYFVLDCSGRSWSPGGWRSFVRAYTTKFSIISPKRALAMKIRERNGIKDPVHSDVFEPVRGQVIHITFEAVASTNITSKLYDIGVLPSLITLHVNNGRNLSIQRYHFNRIPNVRVIVFFMSTIMEMEPYTFKDLPHLSSLSVDKGLWDIFHEMEQGIQRSFVAWTDADLALVHRIHCDCSFAWFRNFLKSKSELLESKQKGTMAVIGSYMSEHFPVFGFDSSVASVHCAENLTSRNYRAGNQFSFNTTCFGSCQ